MKLKKCFEKFAAVSISAAIAFSAIGSVKIMNTSAAVYTTASESERAIAFPGADGAGKFATGGRGGEIYHVTNLNDSGTGSLRDAVSKGRRIVVFDVGGTINLKSDLSISGNVTVMGQTAPGGAGITVRNGKLAMAGDNIIVRYVSSRPGEKGSGDYDAWGGSKGSKSIIDHCSIGWANDEQFGLYSAKNMTVQYTIIGPANCLSTHSKGSHGFGPMFGAGYNSWHHNLICHNMSRNFRGKVESNNSMDFVNNIVYGWGGQTAYGTFGHENFVGNYYKKSISTRNGDNFGALDSGSNYNIAKFYLEGNKMTDRKGSAVNPISTNNWNGGLSLNRNLNYYESHYRSSYHFPIISNGIDVSTAQNPQTADEAFKDVVSYAGAAINPESRTKIDAEVLNDALTGSGSLSGGSANANVTSDVKSKYSIKLVNYDEYYPEAITKKTIIDSDNDGMPDEWETARGLNPNDAGDANGYYIGGAYTNIEHYCNDLTVDSFPNGAVSLSPTLSELGESYPQTIQDLNALKLPKSKISSAEDCVLPAFGSKNNSQIIWSSSSDCVTIEDNQITNVVTPTGTSNETAYLKAEITNGGCTLIKYFTVTVLTSTISWYPSDSDGGAAANTKLADGLYNVSAISVGTLAAGVSIDGSSRTVYMTSDTNGGYSNGVGSGTCLKFTAPYDGKLYGYAAELADTKKLYIVREGVSDYKTEYSGVKDGNGGTVTVSSNVKAGNTYYIFPAGTKGKLLGMKFLKSTKSSTKTESVKENWSFDNIEAGTSYAKGDKIASQNGVNLTVDTGDAHSVTIENRSGSNNCLKISDNGTGRVKWTYSPQTALIGDKAVFEFEFKKGDIEKDTTLLRVYDDVNANADNTYSDGSIIFDLKTSNNKGESSSAESELVLTDYFSEATNTSQKGVDFGFSNFTYKKDIWYGIRLECFKNDNGRNEVALYTKAENKSSYTYRDSVILGSGIQKPNISVDSLTLTPTKAEFLTPGSGSAAISIDNISIGVENQVSSDKPDLPTASPTPTPIATPQPSGSPLPPYDYSIDCSFMQDGQKVESFKDGNLICSLSGSLPTEYTFILAEYDADGIIIRTTSASDLSITITPDSAAVGVRAFVWSGFDTMLPYMNCTEILRQQ